MICARRKPAEAASPAYLDDPTQIVRDGRDAFHQDSTVPHSSTTGRERCSSYQRAPVPHLIRGYVDFQFS
jgi:hypothetical protein